MDSRRQIPINFDVSELASREDVDELLCKIKAFAVGSNADYLAVLELIKKLDGKIDPSIVFVLQFEASMKLFNATKKAEDTVPSIADFMSKRMARESED